MTRVLFFQLFLWASAASAQPVEFFRVTCLPDRGYFSIDHKPVSNGQVFWGDYTDPEGQGKALSEWRKHGFYKGAFEYSCRMADGLYTAKVTRDAFSDGRCGAAPQIRLTLTLGEKTVISDVIIGHDCWGNISVSNLEIVEGHVGWGLSELNLCFYRYGDTPAGYRFLSEAYLNPDLSERLDQKVLEALLAEFDR
jgi:hypothetical protein